MTLIGSSPASLSVNRRLIEWFSAFMTAFVLCYFLMPANITSGGGSTIGEDYVGVNKADLNVGVAPADDVKDNSPSTAEQAARIEELIKKTQLNANPQPLPLDLTLAAMTEPSQWLHTPEEFAQLDEQSQLYSLLKLSRTPSYECKQREVLGGIPSGDGQWNTCFDNWSDTCRVFSFGIDYDFSFDQQVGKRGNCKVASFDPSMQWEEKDIDEHVRYYPVGIAADDSESIDGVRMRDGRPQKWKVATLGTSMKNLDVDRLTVLKMDVEGFEWEAIPEMIKSGALANVDQFIFEVHYFHHAYKGKSSVEHWYNTLKAVKDQGLEMYFSHLNPLSSRGTIAGVRDVACCYEVSFVRPSS